MGAEEPQPHLTLCRTEPNDFAELRRLFDDPALLGWGGPGRAADALIKEKYCGARAPDVECFIVRLDGLAAGLCQLHRADGGGGMDLILLPSARGRGVGREVVRRLLQRATADLHWSRITVDPDADNLAGIAFWRSVGFTELSRHEAHHQRSAYVLMSWTLSRAGSV